MGKLNQIDKKAESKGSGVVTLWQFIKFIFVSLGRLHCAVSVGEPTAVGIPQPL